MTKTRYTGVYCRDLQNGDKTYYIQYKHPKTKKLVRQRIGTKGEGITPQYCKQLRSKTLVKLRLGEDAPIKIRKEIITLQQVADEYFDASEARSIDKLQSVYKIHLSQLKDIDITAIDEDVIDKLRLSKKKEVSLKTGRVLSPKTIGNILATLSAILRFALRKKYIGSVPEINKPKVDNTRERFLSKEEIELLLTTIERSGLPTAKRLLLFTKLSLYTGGRLGSIITIRGKDINRTNRTIILKNHKTGGSYQAFIPQPLLKEIPTLKPNEKLIDVSDPKQIQRPLQNILNKLFNEGLEPEDRKNRVVVHSLRHTFASHLAIAGTPIHIIQKLMDHSDISMTLKYAKLMPDTGREQVENIYG